MKLFEEAYVEFMHWYELVGFSYFLFTFCISFAPAIILIILLFIKGIRKLRKKKYFKKQILKLVQAILKKIRRRDLCPAQTCEKKAVSTWNLF